MVDNTIIFLKHVLDAIEHIDEYIGDISFELFKESIQLQDSVIRRLEIIGEAVKNIPTEIQDQNPDIPWKEMARMRDVLIHKYFGVDLDLTWSAIKEENPRIKSLIKQLLQHLKKSKSN